jgi:hypothetical protein
MAATSLQTAMLAIPLSALLATASGTNGPRGWIVRLIQALVTASLISIALAWSSRAAARRRYRTKATPQRPLLAYPLWTVGLGLGCIVLFSACAWFAWQAPEARGGPKAALVFLVFVLLGVVLVVSCLAESFVVDAAGIERWRFGRCRAIPWSDITRVSIPWGGPGIGLESRRGIRFEVAEMVNGFGVLCDALLLHVVDGFQVVNEASMLVLRGSSLDGEALQRAYARWFEAEEAEPPEAMGPAECALAMGRAFGARLLWHHGSFLPFEARWTLSGQPRITHGEPRGDDPGYARFRLEEREVVIVTDSGTLRESLDA